MGSSEGWSLSFAYDAQQRRIGKTYSAVGGAVTSEVFVYDGPNVLFVFTTESGVTKARRWMNAYGLDKRYGFEDYPGAVPTPGTGTVYEVHQDYLGSVVAVVDPTSGTQVSKYRYDSFGNRTVISESVKPGYGFTGQQFDEETGLGYFRARYYDPKEGRFLSTDPLGFVEGIRNEFVYVANAPYEHIDPSGLITSTGPYAIHTKDRPSNDVYASLIHGTAMGLLLRAFSEFEEFMAGLGPRVELGFMGEEFGFNVPLLSQVRARCRPLSGGNPPPLPVPTNVHSKDRNEHGDPDHWAAMIVRANWLRADNRWIKGGIEIPSLRLKQDQVNADGKRISSCRPDLQYDWAGGVAHNLEEFFRPGAASMNFAKGIVMLRAAAADGGHAGYLGWQLGKVRRSR